MINVLFVCLGNICRSPMAEAIMRHQLKEKGLDQKVMVDSAGTADYHIGAPPHEGTQGKLDEHNIAHDQLKARQIKAADIDKFDYIITMDESNTSSLTKAFRPSDDVKMFKMMSFVPNAKEENVPDPYFTGNFDYTYELLDEACQALIGYLKQRHHIND